MNMDRFEKGPREILNPEIQKVRANPARQPAFNEMQRLCHSISIVSYSVTSLDSSILALRSAQDCKFLHCCLSSGSAGVGGAGGTGWQRYQLFSNGSLSLHVLMYWCLQGSVNFKFGVLYAKEGQLTDDEMFSNGKFLSDSYINPQKLVVNLCAFIYILYHPNLNGCRS